MLAVPFAPKIHVAIPIQDELDNINVLFDCLNAQAVKNFTVVVCINQPDDWWHNDRLFIAQRNCQTLERLQKETRFPVQIIDRCSKGKGWKGKQQGVGWARKLCLDTILMNAESNDLIVSIDADTTFSPNYFALLQQHFSNFSVPSALAVPYYHRLGDDKHANRAMLIYECYMRHYFLNLKRINSPYAFTALGSAIAMTVECYQKTGGMSPLQAGEDFYLLQKVVKTSRLSTTFPEAVYPSARISQRVPFGTGKAIEQQQNAPRELLFRFYEPEHFDAIAQTYALFSVLFSKEVETPMSHFLRKQSRTQDFWMPLRKNFKKESTFVRACHEKIDALRILQFLRTMPAQCSAEESVFKTCHYYGKTFPFESNFSFLTSDIGQLDWLRNELFACCNL